MEHLVLFLLWFLAGCGFAAMCRLVYEASFHWEQLKQDRRRFSLYGRPE